MLMNLHVGHGTVLIFDAALITACAAAEKRQLPEAGVAVTKHAAEKMHAQRDMVTRDIRILNCPPDFFRQVRRQRFVGVQQQNPAEGKGKGSQGPWPLLRQTTWI